MVVVTTISTALEDTIFRVASTLMMTSSKVVETSVITTNNRTSQDYSQLDNQIKWSPVTPKFKSLTLIVIMELSSGRSMKWLFIHCFEVKLEFEAFSVFCWETLKSGEPEGKTLTARHSWALLTLTTRHPKQLKELCHNIFESFFCAQCANFTLMLRVAL